MALNWKSLGAIALMIIVVCPIGMGYLFATDTHEKTEYETSSTHNLSDYILNHRAPYYGDYTGSTNNHAIITEQLINGVWDQTINSPAYADVSDNPSSLPIETWTDHTYATGGTNHDSYVYDTDWSISTSLDYPSTAYITRWPIVHLDVPGAQGPIWELHLYDSAGTEVYYGMAPTNVHMEYNLTTPDDYTYTVTLDDSEHRTFSNVVNWQAFFFAGITLNVGYMMYVDINLDDPEYLMTGAYMAGVWDTRNGIMYKASYVYVTEDTIYVAGHSYDRSVYRPMIVQPYGTSGGLQYRTPSLTDTYGDPALGWTLPNIGTTQARYDYWNNNQVNRGATFYVNLDAGEYVGMMATDTITRSSDVDIRVYRDASGMAYVDQDAGTEAHALGQYSAVQIKITKDSYVVTGIKSWPAIYGPVSGLNSITIDRGATTFTMVKLLQYLNTTAYWRVDLADIEMGEYATTLDATLNLTEIFPAKSIALSMNSIAVYGDSLTVLGAQQPYMIPIDNGRITVGGQTFPLKGSLWLWTLNEDGVTYDLTINGFKLDDIRTDLLRLASIKYGGEWSTIITGYTVTPVTGVVTEWVPGVFAFDAQTMAAAAMLSAVAAFVVLGMTGRRSLPKAGILALICGGGVLVFMLLV